MPRIDVVLSAEVAPSFRVDLVGSIFDVDVRARREWRKIVDLPESDGDWKIGAIVGPSGSGKTQVSRAAFGDYIANYDSWPIDRAVVDGFADDLDVPTITDALSNVGFSSPPCWLLPYRLLSTGQRFRCDLTRALLRRMPVVVVDEFTSVVDRQVGQFASASVAKIIRAGRALVDRFIAVSCHYDILEWLQPDWILDMATGEYTRGCLRRPTIEIEIRRCENQIWRVFESHHYLSSTIHPAAKCYLGTWNGSPVCFVATKQNVGHVGMRLIHRVVVLPDFQGLGIGTRMTEAIALHESERGYRMSIVTSHPAMIRGLLRRSSWSRVSRSAVGHARISVRTGLPSPGTSHGRPVSSFEFLPWRNVNPKS